MPRGVMVAMLVLELVSACDTAMIFLWSSSVQPIGPRPSPADEIEC